MSARATSTPAFRVREAPEAIGRWESEDITYDPHGQADKGYIMPMEPSAGQSLSSLGTGYPKGGPDSPLAPAPGGRKAGQSASISPGPHTARKRITYEVEQVVGDLDQRVTQLSRAESNRVRMNFDQMQRLMEGLQQVRIARDIQRERWQQELKLLEANVARELSNFKKERRDFETQTEEQSARLMQSRVEEIRHQSLETHRDVEEYQTRISHDVERLHGMLEEQKVVRADYEIRINDSLDSHFVKLSQEIEDEEAQRSSASAEMMRMVEGVRQRMRGEVQQEREEREVVQSKLLGLLEDTCQRIEQSFTVQNILAPKFG